MKLRWWIVVLAVLSFGGTLLIYPMLPETIATHWGINGQVDDTGHKSIQLLLAALPLGMYLLMVLLPRIDPRRENYALHDKAYTIFQVVLVVFLIGMNWAAIAYNLGFPVNIQKSVVVSMGLLMLVLGNYMGQFRHNYFCGIRTPWTLANEEVWRRTHRLGGKLYVIAGILIIPSAFLDGTLCFAITMGSILSASLVSVVYSYFAFRNLEDKNTVSKH